jgi:hypothetical protein
MNSITFSDGHIGRDGKHLVSSTDSDAPEINWSSLNEQEDQLWKAKDLQRNNCGRPLPRHRILEDLGFNFACCKLVRMQFYRENGN